MAASSSSFLIRLRGWARAQEARGDGLFLGLLAVAAACLLLAGSLLTAVQQGAFWCAILIGFAILLRRDRLRICGPVPFYDMIQVARRGRYAVVRSIYGLFLLATLYIAFIQTAAMAQFTGLADTNWQDVRQMHRVAEAFFGQFMFFQFGAVALLTPAYVASALGDEKEHRTLEFLLATDLRSRELVLGKLLSRLGNMSLLLLTGLPILSLTQFMGGVDPELLLAFFAATALVMISVASLAILAAVYSRKTREAIVRTYLVLAAYNGLCIAIMILLSVYPWLADVRIFYFDSLPTLGNLLDWFNAGSPLAAVRRLSMGLAARTTLAGVVSGVLREFAVFHGAVAIVCSAWAVLRLRPVATMQMFDTLEKLPRRAVRKARRPRIGNYPMLWKEIFIESGRGLNRAGRLLLALVIGTSFVPAIMIGWESYQRHWSQKEFREAIAISTAIVGSIVASFTLLGVVSRASSTVTLEKDRQTLDSLLTSTLTNSAILFGKLLGAVLSVRWLWLWLGVIWAIAIVCQAMPIHSVLVMAAAWLAYAIFFGTMGLWFSVRSSTTTRASIGALTAALFVGGGHWFCLGSGLVALAQLLRAYQDRDLEYLIKFLVFGLTPPSTFFWPPMLFIQGPPSDTFGEAMGYWLKGMPIWLVATLVLWLHGLHTFGVRTGRTKKQLSADSPIQ